MAYKRGSGTVNVELSRLQDWAENTDVDLYGEYGQRGLVDEHKERMMLEVNARAKGDKSARYLVGVCALLSALDKLPSFIGWIHSLFK